MQNTVQLGRNLIKYLSVQHIVSYIGQFLAKNLQIYLETLSLKHANNIPETTRYRLYCKKLSSSCDVTGFASASFLEHIDDLFEKNVKNAGLISAKPIDYQCPENKDKIGRLFTDCFSAKFTLKIPGKSANFLQICP